MEEGSEHVERHLYHFPLCPFSRKIRVLLNEKGLSYQLHKEPIWQRRKVFAQLNPAMTVPVLQEGDIILADSYAIAEYIEARYPDPALLPGDLVQQAEIRRVTAWFDNKFYQEVGQYLIKEKVFCFYRGGEPSSEALRAARINLVIHLRYIEFLLRDDYCLVGEKRSLADITAAAHISVADYLGDINWDRYPRAKAWYVHIKSNPSFRPLLADKIAGFSSPLHYAELDF